MLLKMIGKWQERDLPARRGFDRFFGTQCAGKISYFNEVQLDPFYLDTRRWKVPAERFYLTDAFTEYAVKFVEEALSKPKLGGPPAPFFLRQHAGDVPLRQRRGARWRLETDEWRLRLRREESVAARRQTHARGQRPGQHARPARHVRGVRAGVGDGEQHAAAQHEAYGLRRSRTS